MINGRFSLVLALGLLAFSPGAVLAEATVSLVKLVEQREAVVEKSTFDGWRTGIQLHLRASGPEMEGARKYGNIKIETAVDDLGTDLTKAHGDRPKQMPGMMQDVPKNRGATGRNGEMPKEGVTFQVELPGLPPRNAAAIQHVKGTIDIIAGGEQKIVKTPAMKSQLGKTIASPALEAAGITFTLAGEAEPNDTEAAKRPRSRAGSDKAVRATIAGEASMVHAIKIVDAQGKNLIRASAGTNEGNVRRVQYQLDQPLPDDAELQIEVWPGQKTHTVPFELKDLKLP